MKYQYMPFGGDKYFTSSAPEQTEVLRKGGLQTREHHHHISKLATMSSSEVEKSTPASRGQTGVISSLDVKLTGLVHEQTIASSAHRR